MKGITHAIQVVPILGYRGSAGRDRGRDIPQFTHTHRQKEIAG